MQITFGTHIDMALCFKREVIAIHIAHRNKIDRAEGQYVMLPNQMKLVDLFLGLPDLILGLIVSLQYL